MFCRGPIVNPIFYNAVTALSDKLLTKPADLAIKTNQDRDAESVVAADNTIVFVAPARGVLPPCFIEWIQRQRGPNMVVSNIWEARTALRTHPHIDTWAIAGPDIPAWLADLLQGDFVGSD